MSKTDEFDDFLHASFAKNKTTIVDDGFSNKVMTQLPAKRVFSIKRGLVLFTSSTMAVLIFIVSNDCRLLFHTIITALTSVVHYIQSPVTLFMALAVCISMLFVFTSLIQNEDISSFK